MDELLNKSKYDLRTLKKYMELNAARELSALSKPCYYPKTKKFYFEVLRLLNITDKDVKAYVKRIYKGTKASGWVLWRDPATNLLVFIMHLFLINNNKSGFNSTLVFYTIIQYSRLMHKQIKYCDEDAFKYTLDTLTRTHLFFREKSIPNSLFYLSQQVAIKYEKGIHEWDIEQIISFIGVIRHRISQSVKSFAENYYRHKKTGNKIKTQLDEPDEDQNVYQYKVLQRGQKVVEEVIKSIIVYKLINRKAFEDAKKYSKIKTSIATMIVDKLSNDKNQNIIKIILQLFLKEIDSVDMLCGDGHFTVVKKLMAVKRTIATVYFKSQVNILLKNVLEDMNFTEEYERYTAQTQFIINTFLAFYLTSYLRYKIC